MKTRRSFLTASGLTAVALAAGPAMADDMPAAENALQYLTSQPRFSDFVRIVKYAGLTQYASGADKFTLFAPTNSGFSKFPDLLNQLLEGQSRAFPDTDKAVHFVRSHVLLDLHPLSEASGKIATMTSAFGTPLVIDGTKSGTYLVTWSSVASKTATAQISGPPIVTSNAIIYPVDAVVIVTDTQ